MYNKNKNFQLYILKYFYFIIIALFILFVTYNCANQGSLSGGPKDETPPVLLKSKPANFSKNFKGKYIELYFDEYVQLKDANKKLIISPPMEKKPNIVLKGKSIEIEFNEDLLENTTYTLNFADAIVDNNEGNAIPQFEFVFSTGKEIDSLSFTGKVIDAFTNKPAEDVFAMLYDNLDDSVPLKHVPFYLSRTDENGEFKMNNMKLDTFKLFVLKDINLNYIYDTREEFIAFADSFVQFNLTEVYITDTTDNDSVIETISKQYIAESPILFLFQEKDDLQYLAEDERPERYKLMFVFNRPLFDIITINPVFYNPEGNWFIKEDFILNDTVVYWLTDTAMINSDTIRFSVNYSVLDSSNNLIYKSDTVLLRYREISLIRKKKRKEDIDTIPQIEYLTLSISPSSGSKLELNSNFVIEPENPISFIDTSKIHLFKIIEDTIEIEIQYNFIKHNFYLRRYIVNNNWEENTVYKLFIEPGAFTDIYGLYNDTTISVSGSRSLDYYGILLLNMQNVSSPLVIQLLNNKEILVRELFCEQDELLKFEYIKPGNYILKLIYDDNKNKKWDTGNYLEKIQPEHVNYFLNEVTIRANWDVEQTWNIAE